MISWLPISKDSNQEEWDRIAEETQKQVLGAFAMPPELMAPEVVKTGNTKACYICGYALASIEARFEYAEHFINVHHYCWLPYSK